MISLTVVGIAFAIEHPSIRDSLHSMDNCHTLVGFAFVRIVVNSCCAAAPEPVPATVAKRLKRAFISQIIGRHKQYDTDKIQIDNCKHTWAISRAKSLCVIILLMLLMFILFCHAYLNSSRRLKKNHISDVCSSVFKKQQISTLT